MDLSPLPEPLRAAITRKLARQPKLAAIVESQLGKRAEATDEATRARIDSNLAFIAKPDHGRLWMLLAVGGVAVALGVSLYVTNRSNEAIARGTPTTAQVTRAEPRSCTFGAKSSRCLKLTLKLYPEGGAPYEGSLTQSIGLEWMSRVQPGSWLTVAVDPADPQGILYDERTMYVAPPAPPPSAAP